MQHYTRRLAGIIVTIGYSAVTTDLLPVINQLI
jgi:hypothetical protein